MTDPCNLIQRLADFLEEITEELVIPEYAHTEEERTDAALFLVKEARRYLAQPEPEDPTLESLQAQIHALRADYLRMANAVAKQVPHRSKLFADLMPDCKEDSYELEAQQPFQER